MLICIKNGLVHTGITEEIQNADILIKDGKFLEISPCLTLPADCEAVDASGLHVYPGLVDAHCHVGLDGYAIGYEGMDYNELNDPVTPQLRAQDGINPMDPSLKMAALAGVTTIGTGPGSSNPIGGTFIAMKTVGRRVDTMIVKAPVAMKCAFGENPKRCYQSKGISSRMTNASLIREMFYKAAAYDAKKQAAGDDLSKLPVYDAKCEALLPVLHREIPLKAHAHQANDLFTALRIAKEFNLAITLEHVTEGHLIDEELAEENVPLAVGPTLTNASKFELQNKSWTTPGVLAKAGCQVSIITDAPVIPIQYLPLCAGLACKAGLSEFDALKAITINPAKHLGIADRVGSIEPGKDADLVITDGNPFSVETSVKAVYINGTLVK
ncbi:MAG: amidohydrolase [Lachnospiraceae bacterium]|nr:amidohydrolase [Lachnospiraceae bacterium]